MKTRKRKKRWCEVSALLDQVLLLLTVIVFCLLQVWFNTCTPEELLAITSCSAIQATSIVSLRPFESTDDLRAKLTKKKGVSSRLFDGYIEVMQGYHEVDAVLKGCEKVGHELERAMSAFMQLKEDDDESRAGELSVVNVDIDVEQELAEETDELRREALKGCLKEQPKTMTEGVQLKDYQVSRPVAIWSAMPLLINATTSVAWDQLAQPAVQSRPVMYLGRRDGYAPFPSPLLQTPYA